MISIFIESVAVPELLSSVYHQIDSLLSSYNLKSKREKREANTSLKEMDCQLFIEMLSLFEILKDLTSSAEMIIEKQEKIQETANSIQMFSIFNGISIQSCENINQSKLEASVNSAKNSLGNNNMLLNNKLLSFIWKKFNFI